MALLLITAFSRLSQYFRARPSREEFSTGGLQNPLRHWNFMKPSPGILITQMPDLDPEGGRWVVPVLQGNSPLPHLTRGGKFITATSTGCRLWNSIAGLVTVPVSAGRIFPGAWSYFPIFMSLFWGQGEFNAEIISSGWPRGVEATRCSWCCAESGRDRGGFLPADLSPACVLCS